MQYKEKFLTLKKFQVSSFKVLFRKKSNSIYLHHFLNNWINSTTSNIYAEVIEKKTKKKTNKQTNKLQIFSPVTLMVKWENRNNIPLFLHSASFGSGLKDQSDTCKCCTFIQFDPVSFSLCRHNCRFPMLLTEGALWSTWSLFCSSLRLMNIFVTRMRFSTRKIFLEWFHLKEKAAKNILPAAGLCSVPEPGIEPGAFRSSV